MNSRIIAGILIIVVGLGFLFDDMIGYSFGSIVANWWPLLIIGFGIKVLSDNSRNLVNAIAIIFVGLLILLTNLDIISGSFFSNFWPLILILAGIYFIANKGHRNKKMRTTDTDFSISSIFSGNHQIIEADDFKNGSVLALFGGAEIDLRNSDIKDEAFIDITCMFGGIEIKIPEGWAVRSHGTPILGGFENKTNTFSERKPDMPVLNINFLVMFGGIDVKD